MLSFSLDIQHNETQCCSGWLPFRLDKMYFQVVSEHGVQSDSVFNLEICILFSFRLQFMCNSSPLLFQLPLILIYLFVRFLRKGLFTQNHAYFKRTFFQVSVAFIFIVFHIVYVLENLQKHDLYFFLAYLNKRECGNFGPLLCFHN